MSLPWKKDELLNLTSNSYSTKLDLNRCLSRLLDNDKYLFDVFNSNIDRAVGLRFASDSEVIALTSPSGAISPATIMNLSATYNEVLTGVVSGDKFITPNVMDQAFLDNTILPKLTYIDITYIGNMFSMFQIVNAAKSEINNFDTPSDTLIYVHCLYGNTATTLNATQSAALMNYNTRYSGSVITKSTPPIPTLSGSNERIFTFRRGDFQGDWEYIRERDTYELSAYERADGYKSLF